MSAVAGWPFLITHPSSLAMADSKVCYWCDMGCFFVKSPFHGDSCPIKSLAVKAVKRKRQEEPKENMVQKLPKLSDHEVAMSCH